MATTSRKPKPSKAAPRVKKAKKQMMMKPPGTYIDQPALAHAKLLYDPCGAELVASVYPGDRGYVNRFTSTLSLAQAVGQTCGAIIIKPGNALTHISADSLSSLTSVMAFGPGNFPGNTFYSTNAAKQRAVAACINISPNASLTNVTGTFHFGVVSAASVINGTSKTFDELAEMCTERIAAATLLTQPLEVKWVPGSFDDRYCPQGVTDDDSDRNLILVVFRGLPAASGITARLTAVTEWVPKTNLGIAFDATATKPSDCDKECVIKYLNSRDKTWWWNLGSKVFNITTRAAKGFASGGFLGAATSFL